MNQNPVCLLYEVEILTHPVCRTTVIVISKQLLGGNSLEAEVSNNNPFTYISDTLLNDPYNSIKDGQTSFEKSKLKHKLVPFR